MPVMRERVSRIPEADRQARKVRGTERCRFGYSRPHHRDAEQVGLKLQQTVVRGGTAIYSQLRQLDSGVVFHGGQEIGDLERDALDGGPRDVPGRGPARDPYDSSARIGIPMRRAQPGKGGHEVHTPVVRH